MKIFITILLAFGFLSGAKAQVNGIVYGAVEKGKRIPLYGAKIRLLKGDGRAISKEDGTFELILDKKQLPDTMIITAMGYNPDTVAVTKKDRFAAFDITLYSDQLLPEVIVAAKQESKSILRLKILAIENLSQQELRKAACCNLSESFETNVSVDVSISDAVSGAKKIQMMGLSGIYTQIQMENIPYLQGTETPFGLMTIPGTWVNSIQITKGSGTVVNGYESMAGLINLTMNHPGTMEKWFVNAYTNRFGRAELNANTAFHLNKKWSSAWMAGASYLPREFDDNGDGFMDLPKTLHAGIFNRYAYEGDKMEAQIGWNGYLHDMVGGQIGYRGVETDTLFGVQNVSEHLDVFAKTGFFLKKPLHSIGVIYNGKYQRMGALFGNRNFSALERRGYINAIYTGIIGSSIHTYKLGVSGVYLDLDQKLNALDASRVEMVPGTFGEYTFEGVRMSVVAGARYDYHNLFGSQFSPRVHTKWKLSERTDLRVTAGRGWRVPNFILDNLSLLATGRDWVAPDTLLPEISWNAGGSIVQRFNMKNGGGSLTVDYYHTRFMRQLIIDRDANVSAFVFRNTEETSYSNSLQVELAMPLLKNFDVRLAYKWLDVKAVFNDELQRTPFVPTHRGFVNFAYKTRNKRWEYDLTTSVFGPARLPVAMLPDGSETTNNTSSAVPMVSAQITHVYKRWEFYLGGENLLNYKQANPIINAENPFSSTFDATRVWAPIIGSNVYLGVRFTIESKEEEDESGY